MLVSLMLLAFPAIPTAAAAEPAAESNIGFVIYTKSLAPGTLNARWMYTTKYKGPGIATGGPRNGFAGRYHVRYFLESGDFSDEYDLLIEKIDDIYKVSWIVKGKLIGGGLAPGRVTKREGRCFATGERVFLGWYRDQAGTGPMQGIRVGCGGKI